MRSPGATTRNERRLLPFVFRSEDRAFATNLAARLAHAIEATTGRIASVVDPIEDLANVAALARRAREDEASDVIVCVPSDRACALAPLLADARAVIAVCAGEIDAAARAILAEAGERAFVLTESSPGTTLRDQRRADARAGARVFGSGTGARGLGALARTVAGKRVGVALGAGGSRGYAHIGVLERLAELGVPIDCMTGSSAGAGIGALWSLGQDAARIEASFAELGKHAVRPAVPFRSLLDGGALEAHLVRCANGGAFEDMPWPFGVVAVDLYAAREEVITTGNLARSVLASCAIPGVYPAVDLDGRWFVDGGLLHPVPASAASALGADVVIGIDLSVVAPRSAPRRAPNALETVRRATAIVANRIRESSTAHAAIVLRPCAEAAPTVFDYGSARGNRALGRKAVDTALPHLRAALLWL